MNQRVELDQMIVGVRAALYLETDNLLPIGWKLQVLADRCVQAGYPDGIED